MPKTIWTHVGDCSVDSGQLIIIDPCYLDEWRDGEFNLTKYEELSEKGEKFDNWPPADNSYDEACRVTLENRAGPVHNGLAVVTSTGFGDGTYPVMARIEGGRVMEISIKFDEKDEEVEDEDEWIDA